MAKDNIRVLISEEDVNARIKEIGEQISKDYEGEEVFVIAILKGAAFFACELAKRISVPVIIDFMSASSYGAGTVSTGAVSIYKDINIDPAGKNIIIVEDIIDTGRTLSILSETFAERKAKSVKLCSLLDKPDRREVEVEMDYVGFTVPNEFIVGFGLDVDQKYRNLPYIGIYEGGE